MRSPRTAVRGLGGLSFLPLLALFFLTGCQRVPPPKEDTPTAPVKWQGASELSLEEWAELVGSTAPLPDHVARISSAVEGRVRTVLATVDSKPVAEGQRVEAGTVLVQLDDTIPRSNLARLEAGQEVLREEEQQARLAVDLAQNEVQRVRRLEGDQRPGSLPLVSTVDREKAEIGLKDAQSKLNGARAKITAGLKEIEALQAQLRLYSLTAPIVGRVGRLQVVTGQALSVGAPVADVVDLDDDIDVLCFVPAGLLRRLHVGQAARSGPLERDPTAKDPVVEGTIAYIADQAEPETGNFAVKVRFPNKDAKLRANRVLRISVLVTPARECLAVPESAVMEDEEPPSVLVVENIQMKKNDEGKDETVGVARRLQVVLGTRDRVTHTIEILRLIDPEKKWQGDLKEAQFVTEGGPGLQTGDAVKLDVDED
jgi:RND family efflux transporter MFP subunit